MAYDAALAYFNASSVFVKLCEEERGHKDEGMCGEHAMSMYGTLSAGRHWQKRYTDLLLNCGFPVTRGMTCMFGLE